MKKLMIALIAGMFSLPGIVSAEAEIPEFAKADKDGSQFVEQVEFTSVKEMAGVEKTLADLDESGDGKLSKDEYSILLEAECE